MALDRRLTGREDKRLPVMLEAWLVPVDNMGAQDKACVENISAHGARVYANGPRQPGEHVEIITLTGEGPMRGDVIYCQKLSDGRFVIGLNLRRSPVLSSLVQKLKSMI